jgi:hypothetical protein
MEKREFEALALRNNAEIGWLMYESIEKYYMSDSNYHNIYGGRNESKQDFVKRVFGGKTNTPKTIAQKIADEAVKANNWTLNGNARMDKKTLEYQETLIREHYEALLKYAM